MNTIEEYLHRNESALRQLLEASHSYIHILKNAPSPTFVSSAPANGNVQALIAAWVADNETAINTSLAAQRRFIAESVARAAICGSILQITYMAVQLYSTNEVIPPAFQSVVVPKNASKFCIGREIRGVPVGLIIYAGRNQHNHMDEMRLSPLNETVFEYLTTRYIENVRDPAFDIQKRNLLAYAANIVSLLEWEKYETVRDELMSMLSKG